MSKTKETEIRLDHRNYRKHNKENKRVIRKSLEELGAGRSIVIDNEGEIIAGNGVFEQAQELGIPVRIIETDGAELIAVKRKDLATDDERRKKLALADNAASDASEWAQDLLREDWSQEALAEFGVQLPEHDINKILDEADFESLSDVTRKKSGVREISFVFSNEQAAVILAYIKNNSKDILQQKIFEICQS